MQLDDTKILKTLMEMLEDPSQPPEVRLKIAKFLFRLAGRNV